MGYRRFNKHSGKEVEWNDIVKGYEYEKDQYVVLSDEDLWRAKDLMRRIEEKIKKGQTKEITEPEEAAN